MKSKILLAITLIVLAISGSLLPETEAKGKKASKPAKAANVKAAGRHERGNKLNSPAYVAAVKQYSDGHYRDAMEAFQALDRSGMCCDMVHYYMALCCQRRNQMQWAIDNYNYVVSYSKDERLKSYAWQAANQLAHYQSNRTYEGNGNVFQGQIAGRACGPAVSGAAMGGGGGGGG